jgi:hypothetical protein
MDQHGGFHPEPSQGAHRVTGDGLEPEPLNWGQIAHISQTGEPGFD